MRFKKIITVFFCFVLLTCAVPTSASEKLYPFTQKYDVYKLMSGIDIYDNGCVVDNGVLIDYIGTEPKAVVPDGVVAIKKKKDSDWGNLESIVVPESVLEIGDWAFYNSSLKEASIPETTKIGYMTFNGCNYMADEQGLVIINGVLHYISPMLFPESGTYISNRHIEVPEGVTEIRRTMYDFENYRVTKVKLPSTLKEISSCAFQNVNEIYLNDGIEFIPDFAFENGSSIKRFPKTLKHMGDFEWRDASETALELPDELEYIGNDYFILSDMFYDSNQQYVRKLTAKGPAGSYIEAHCKNPQFAQYIQFEPMGEADNNNGEKYWTKKGEATIDNPEDDIYEFIGNRLVGYHNFTDTLNKHSSTDRSKTLYLPEETEIVGNYAFASNTYLDYSVHLPENVVSIEKRAFSSYKLKEIYWNSGLKTIGERSFYTSGLREAELPDGLETIGDGAFEYSRTLANVTIPETVSSIGKNAFRDCGRLNNIIVPEKTDVGESAFKGCANLADKNGLVIVNGILYDAAKCTDRHLILPKNIKSISTDTFRGVTAKYIYVPQEIKEISSNAFSENSVLFGQQNSAIQKYASENNLPFYEVQEENFNDIAELIEKGVNTPYGDLNSNGSVELEDTRILLKYALKIKDDEVINYENLDANQDGSVDLDDVITDLKTALKIEREIYPEHVPQIIPHK